MSSPLNLDAFVDALREVGFVVRDAGLLASALERPHTTLFGEEVYPTLAEKAAAMGHAIAKYHPMLDGNKRSAWIGMNVFLELNGFDVDASVDEAFDFMLDIANDRIELPAIASWLEARMKPLS
ncbi:MAG: type II toxin-antitoxin system death-on-curing family toxin [Pontimonas sp.]